LRLIRGRGADLCDDAWVLHGVTMNNTEPEEGDEHELAGAEERRGGGDNDGRVVGVGGERRAGHLQRIGGFIGSNRTVLGTAAPDDDDDNDNDDGGSDPNKRLRKVCCATFGSIFWFFLWVCSGLGLLFSLIFSMAPATFRVIECSDFRMKKILKRVNLPL
jgi:hypothetical protein